MRPPVTQWAYKSVFVRMVVVTIAVLTGVAVLSGVAPTPASAQVPDSTITVSISYGSIWANGFEPGGDLTITVGTTDAGTWPIDDGGNFDGNNYGLQLDVAPGSTVTASDGTNTKSLTLANLEATSFNEGNLTVAGTTDTGDTPAGSAISVNFGSAWRSVPVTGGAWTADFATEPIADGDGVLPSFGAAMGGWAMVSDSDGDATQIDWTSGSIHVRVDDDWLWGNGFAEGPIDLTVAGVAVDPAPVADANGDFDVNLADRGFTLAAGQEIVAYQDPWTAEVTLVDLAITNVDASTGVVSGIAPEGALVDVHAWTTDGYASRVSTAGTGDTFSVDFSVAGGPDSWGPDVVTLGPGTGLRAHIYDDRDLPEHDATVSDWYISNPRFKARVDDNGFSGWEWEPNSTVTVTIASDPARAFDFATDEWGNFDGQVDTDVAVGQYVEATDGVSTKDMVVRNLIVTDIDVANDTVTGVSEPGDAIYVSVHDEIGTYRNVEADSSGNWTADFSDVWEDQSTYDIVSGTSGNAHFWEADGDETQRTWHIANPTITASVSHDEVWATDFPDDPDGQVLYYRLDDPATTGIDFEGDMPLLITDGWSESGDRSFGRYDVYGGQILTVRNRPFDEPIGTGIERVLQVSHIEVTAVDGDNDVISGYADPGEGDYLCVWSADNELCSDSASFTWNGDGTWVADFAAIGSDVKPGHWNEASQYEDDGDRTHFWWNLPPWVVVELAEEDESGTPLWPDLVHAEGWTGLVTLTINSNYIAEWEITGEWDYTFDPGIDIDPGDLVTLSNGDDTKSFLVEPLTIDQINFATDTPPNTVYGTANPYRNLRVDARASVGGWWAERWVNADSAGDFVADFGNPGNGWREQWTADFGGAEGLGRYMYSEIYDEDNDRVQTYTCRGLPRVEIARSDGRVDAIDFPEDTLVSLEIIGSEGSYSGEAVAVRNPDNPCETIASFDVGDFPIEEGATVTVTAPDGQGGTTTVTHNVIAFSVDTADPEADTVSGTAPVGAQVLVEADGGNWRYVTAEDDGTGVGHWLANFAQQGTEPGEEQVVDLVPGSSGRAIMLDGEGNTTELNWRIAVTQFQVEPYSENIWGQDWQPNADLSVQVNSVDLPGGPYATDGWGNIDIGLDSFDLQANDYIVVSDGVTTKDHTVTDLAITDINTETDTISGTATDGIEVCVDVWDWGQGCTFSTGGLWSIDVNSAVFGYADLGLGMGGNATQTDGDGDTTQVNWSVRNPAFQVDPFSENIWGQDWEPNVPVSITVNGDDVPGGPYSTDEWGNFNAGWDSAEMDVQAGNYVVVSDGITTKDHYVTDLTITGVDPMTDVVTGTAAAGSQLDVWVHDVDSVWRTTEADSSGNWSVDFKVPGDDPGEENTTDLQPGSNGNSGQCDDDGDCTNAFWQVAQLPWVTGDAGNDQIWGGGDWSLDESITITVDDPLTPTEPDYTTSVTMEPTEWDPNQYEFNIYVGDDIDLQPGLVIVAAGPNYTKTLTLTNLAITTIDLEEDAVSGTADDGIDVYIDGGNDEENDWASRVVTPSDGGFTAFFAVPGSGENEQSTVDLMPGSRGTAQQYDEDGDYTHAFWNVPYPPTISVVTGNLGSGPESQSVEGYNWDPTADVAVEIDSPSNGEGVDYSTTATPDEWGNVWLNPYSEGGYTILPEDAVMLSQGATSITHTVTEVIVTAVDAEANTVSGTAAAGSEVTVGIWGPFGYRVVNADGDGNWMADFSVAWEDQEAVDLRPQDCDPGDGEPCSPTYGEAWQADENGNQTRYFWSVAEPPWIVVTWGGSIPGLPQVDTVEGHNWPEGEPLTVTVADGSTTQSWTLNVGEQVHADPPWWFDTRDDLGTSFQLHLDGVYDLAPGQVVTVTSPSWEKSVEIVWVTIDAIDLDNDVVSGSDPGGHDVQVTINQPWQEEGPVAGRSTGGASSWTVDFSVEPPDGWGTADIDLGTTVSTDVWDEDGDASAINRYIPLPTFSVETPYDIWSSNQDWMFWSEDTPVYITVGDDEFETAVEVWGEAPWETGFGLHVEPYEIVPGDVVSVTVGSITKVLHVEDITITEVNEDADTVSGYAPPGSTVEVDANDEFGGAHRSEIADPVTGYWTADFSQPGDEEHEQDAWDLVPGTNISAQLFDEDGDSTHRGANVEEPRFPTFSVRMESNQIVGYNWPEEAEVTVTVDDPATPDPVDYTATGSPEPGEWDDYPVVVFSPNEVGFELQPGFYVEMTDGSTTKTHIVTNITVTDIDPEADTVSGYAESDADVNISVGDCSERWIHSDGAGYWLADFAAPGTQESEQGTCDITSGTEGDAQELDEDGDETHIYWRLPGEPEFGVSATHDWIEFNDFTGTFLTFTFDEDEDPSNGVLYEETIEPEPDASGWIHLIQGFDVEVGQFVMVTDGMTTKSTYVAPLAIDEPTSWVISGTTDPNVEIDVFGFHPDFGGFGAEGILTDGSGHWSFDIASVVDELPATIPDGVVLGAGQRDEDSDRTIVFWDPAVVEGHVYVEGQPVAGAEVYYQGTIGSQHTCTDDDGYYRFDNVSVVKALVSQGIAATGRAVSPSAACANAEFVDGDGIPLLTEIVFGPFDLQDGYEYIGFDVDRAGAYQDVVVEEYDGANWLPVDQVLVRAYDVADPDFIAVFGDDPLAEEYPAIWNSDVALIGLDFTGIYTAGDPGSAELRYPYANDVLILIEYVDGSILGDVTGAGEFADRGDGVLVGPTIVFPPPDITSLVGTDEPIEIGTLAAITGTYIGPNDGDHAVTIDWGDGTVDPGTASEGAFAGDHIYDEPGVYAVAVTVTDPIGMSDTEVFRYIVVYDPDGGFVTGGGWIESPEGAYLPDPTLTGTATFGFVSKYKKGDKVPTGNTEFQFHAGDLNFHSDEYQWLVVAGAKAMFKGTGTINGEGSYGFLISATDAALTPSTDVDLFRIKIWDIATDAVVYDNQMGDADDAEPMTEIAGGNIVVHDGKKVK